LKIAAQIRWTLGPVDIEPRIVTLLEAVARHGNLQEAARSAGLSYRHSWNLLEELARELGEPLTLRHQGRGTMLAPLGSKLLEGMVDVNGTLAAALREGEARMQAHLARTRVISGDPLPLVLSASPDPVLARLPGETAANRTFSLTVAFKDSIDGLADLRRKRCELAGFPLPAMPGAKPVAPLRPFLRLKGWRALHLFDRMQGLIVPAGNPRSLKDLAHSQFRVARGPQDSVTRAGLDLLLSRQGIRPGGIVDFGSSAEATAAVANGMADAAFVTETEASATGLGFVPVVAERYCLAARGTVLRNPAVQALLAWLESPEFRHLLGAIPGVKPATVLQWKDAADIIAG